MGWWGAGTLTFSTGTWTNGTASATTDAAAAAAALSTAQTNLGPLEDALTLASDALTAANNTLTSANTDLQSANSTFSAYEGDLLTLAEARNQTQADLDAATALRDSKSGLLTTANSSLATAETTLTNKTTALDAANLAKTDAETALAAKQTVLDAANAAVTAAEAALGGDTLGSLAGNLNTAREALRLAEQDFATASDALTLADRSKADLDASYFEKLSLSNQANSNATAAQSLTSLKQAQLDSANTQLTLADDTLTATTAALDASNAALQPQESALAVNLAALDAANTTKTTLQAALNERSVALAAAQDPVASQAAYDTAFAAFTAAETTQATALLEYQTVSTDIESFRATQQKAQSDYTAALTLKLQQEQLLGSATEQLAGVDANLVTQTASLDDANAVLNPLDADLASKLSVLNAANGSKSLAGSALTLAEEKLALAPTDPDLIAARDAAQATFDQEDSNQVAAEVAYNSVAVDPALIAARTNQQKALAAYNTALEAKQNQDLLITTATSQLALAQTTLDANTAALSDANTALAPQEQTLSEKLAALNAANTNKTVFEAALAERQIALTAAQNPAAAQAAYDAALASFDTATADQLALQTSYNTALTDIEALRIAQQKAESENDAALSNKNNQLSLQAQAQTAYDAAAADQILKDAAAAAALAAIPDRAAVIDAVANARLAYDAALAVVRTSEDAVGVAQDTYDTAAAESADVNQARQWQTGAKADATAATLLVQTSTASATQAQTEYDAALIDRDAKIDSQISAQTAFDNAELDLTPLQNATTSALNDYNALANDPAVADALQAKTDAQSAYNTALSDQTTKAQEKATALAARNAAQLLVDNATAAVNDRPSFAQSSTSTDATIAVTSTDTVATLAAKINSANIGIIAVVFKDGVNDRLQLTSKATGVDAGFRVRVDDTGDLNNTDGTGLSRFGFDPATLAYGMASSGAPAQFGQNASARINGLTVTSSTNTLTDNFPGVTINLVSTTTKGLGTAGESKSPVTIAVREDVTPSVKNVQDFITAYNALNASLADLTKYDAATKTPSLFQGDAAVLGLQSILRGMLGSISTGSSYSRLADVGIQRKLDGSLSLNTSKLSTAANNGTELVKLFTQDNKNAQSNGFALKFSAFSKAVLATGGAVANKAVALQKVLDRNGVEQTRINDRAAVTEARLRRQYSALDAKMAGLTALNAYVAQQVTSWNKSTG